MGCFLACFGFKEKKKRRKPRHKNPSLDNQSYVPLDSNVKENLTSDIGGVSQPKERPSILKIKKKVRFNLNVKAYEPIPEDDEVGVYLSEGVEETNNTSGLHYEEDAIASSIASYPASYRYQNCRYSDDEEEDEDEIDLDEIEESDQEVDDVSSIRSDDTESDNDVTKNQVQTSVVDLQQLRATESRSNARRYASSVLSPVENLSQWRVVKAKAATKQLKLQKENLILSATDPHSDSKVRNTVAVDASLSNWLSSSEMSPLIKSSTPAQIRPVRSCIANI